MPASIQVQCHHLLSPSKLLPPPSSDDNEANCKDGAQGAYDDGKH